MKNKINEIKDDCTKLANGLIKKSIENLKQIIERQILIKCDFPNWDGHSNDSLTEYFEIEYNGDVLCTVEAYVCLNTTSPKVDADYGEYPENAECMITVESIKFIDTIWSGNGNICQNITDALRKEYGQESVYGECVNETLKNLFKNLAPQNN